MLFPSDKEKRGWGQWFNVLQCYGIVGYVTTAYPDHKNLRYYILKGSLLE